MGGAKSMGGTGRGGRGHRRGRAPPRPRVLAPPEVVVPGVHLMFLLKVKPVRAVVSARAFAAARGSRGQLGT